MTLPRLTESPLVRSAGSSYFPLAFVARLPFAMMVVGVLTLVVAERGSVTLGGLNSAAAGLGTALAGPLLGAAVDRFGQRRVLVPVGLVNATLLGAFLFVVAGIAPDLAVLALSVLIGASAPQVGPLSRTRLVAIIGRHRARPPREGPQRHHGLRVGGRRDRLHRRPVPRRAARQRDRPVGGHRRRLGADVRVRHRVRPAPHRPARPQPGRLRRPRRPPGSSSGSPCSPSSSARSASASSSARR